MTLLVPARVETEELLDDHAAPLPDVERSLRDLRRINRYLFGNSVYRRLFRRLTAGLPGPLTLLDVGTGTSDLSPALSDPRGVSSTGVDFKIEHLRYGVETGSRDVSRVAADAFRLPFLDGSFDVVTSAHFFHHFSAEENVILLTEALRVARHGVIVNDTRRNHVPLMLVRILGALRLVGRITKFDAPASVLRGYTTAEARGVAARLVARRVEVKKIFPFRFGVLLWK